MEDALSSIEGSGYYMWLIKQFARWRWRPYMRGVVRMYAYSSYVHMYACRYVCVANAVRALPARVSASAPALLGVWSRLGLYLDRFLSALFPE